MFVDTQGRTMLMVAASKGRLACATVLLKQWSADPNVQVRPHPFDTGYVPMLYSGKPGANRRYQRGTRTETRGLRASHYRY